jgi:D-beta-D-heptose 7-phosphate kinase/D-beta-D-heptose 1-phosphate adenosyltransferase
MCESLLKIVTNLGSPKVLVVGDFMLDIYIYGDALRISPEAPVPVLKVTNTEYRCGGAGSVAANLAAFDAKPYCLGIIGNDQNGKTLKQKLTDTGADITNIPETSDRPTISKQRLIGLAQHRHRQQLIRMDQESTEPFSEAHYGRILQAYKDILTEVDIVCLQDYNKGVLSSSLCKEMIPLAIQANKKVLVDPSLTSDYTKYAGATLITPNRKEASMVTGIEIQTVQTAAKAAEKLYTDLMLTSVVITLDKEGAYLKTETQSELVPTKPRSVYDVTGAGDIVLAMLAITLAAGYDYKTAVQLSNIAGGIEVEKFGAATVTIDEIANELIKQDTRQNNKLKSIDTLTEELAVCRKQKRTIVFTNGCFDVIHRGHVEYLNFCRCHGDVVVIGLNSDSSVKTIKGPERPVNNQKDRAAVLAAIEAVDYITIFDEPDPLNLIKQVKPDVLIKGEDWVGQGVIGREFVESYGGKVILAPLVDGKSSTVTIDKMNSLHTKT